MRDRQRLERFGQVWLEQRCAEEERSGCMPLSFRYLWGEEGEWA